MNGLKNIALLLTFTVSMAIGQQITQFTQYTKNKFIINPAASGLNNKLNVAMGYRNQWSTNQFEAPSAYYFGGDYNLNKDKERSYIDNSIRVSNPDLFKQSSEEGKNKHVLGGYIVGNNFLPVKNMAVSGLYSFHYALDEFYIAGGGALTFNQYRTNLKEIELFQQDDDGYKSFLNKKNQTSFVDMNLGIMVYSHNIYFGYSVVNLAPNKLRLNKDFSEVDLNTHHYVSFGTKQLINEKVNLHPSVLIRGLRNAPTSFDFNVLATYDDKYSFGASYRHNDAYAFMAGVTFNHHYTFSYSYDVTTSALKQVSNGTHELLLLAKF